MNQSAIVPPITQELAADQALVAMDHLADMLKAYRGLEGLFDSYGGQVDLEFMKRENLYSLMKAVNAGVQPAIEEALNACRTANEIANLPATQRRGTK